MSVDARFSIIPGWIVTDPRLKGRDLQVLCLLGRHTDKHGWCRRSQVKMADQLGCARSTVQSSLDRLGEIGVVEKHVEDSADGRDSAHSYRVIYDAPPPSGYAFDAWDGAEIEDVIPNSVPQNDTPPCRYIGTPAGPESAPPAGPESAPPAGPESAPINDPYLTTQEKRSEREAREENRQIDRDRNKKLDARFWNLAKKWPGLTGMPKEQAKVAWYALTDDERDLAERRFDAWLELLKAQRKSHTPAPRTYFSEKLFNDVPDPSEKLPVPAPAPPFGKAWSARRLILLGQPCGALPKLSAFNQARYDAADGRGRNEILAEHRSANGWPSVRLMHERALEGRSVAVSPADVEAGREFTQVRIGSEVWEAFRSVHQERGYPWLPETGRQEWVYFPRLDGTGDLINSVRSAIDSFHEQYGVTNDAA